MSTVGALVRSAVRLAPHEDLDRLLPYQIETPRVPRGVGEGAPSGRPLVRDFKDTVYPFFESCTLFLECIFAVFFVI